MKNIWSICKKEIRTYFTSPIAYIVIFVFLALVGFFFYSLIWWFNSQSLQMARNPYYYQQLNINQMVYSPLFHNISIILLLMIPLLSMRLFAEEKKLQTDELLYTSPLSINQIILGKYFASLFVLLVMLALSGILSIFTFAHGNPEMAPTLTTCHLTDENLYWERRKADVGRGKGQLTRTLDSMDKWTVLTYGQCGLKSLVTTKDTRDMSHCLHVKFVGFTLSGHLDRLSNWTVQDIVRL